MVMFSRLTSGFPKYCWGAGFLWLAKTSLTSLSFQAVPVLAPSPFQLGLGHRLKERVPALGQGCQDVRTPPTLLLASVATGKLLVDMGGGK